MSRIIAGRTKTGFIWGDHDVGITAWTIRWKTAGWSRRDDMSVWSHCGFFHTSPEFIPDFNDWQICHMLDQYTMQTVWRNLDNPGDNPGYTSELGPWVINAWQWGIYYAYFVLDEMRYSPASYDYGNVIGQFFGTSHVFGTSKDMICTELTWNVLCAIERTAGLRMTYGGYDYWPVRENTTSPLIVIGRNWTNYEATKCCFATPSETSFLTPWYQQTRYNRRWCPCWNRSFFVS